jgi:hypothetical protein
MGSIGDLWEWADGCILYHADKSVRAWNYVTGRQKKDLANNLLRVGYVTACFGYVPMALSGSFPFFVGGLAFIHFMLDQYAKRINKLQEEAEEKRSKEGELGGPIYVFDQMHRWGSTRRLALGGVIYLLPSEQSSLVSLGFGIDAFSHYVMRVPDLPRRKNVVARAKDRVLEKIAELGPKPAVQPARV